MHYVMQFMQVQASIKHWLYNCYSRVPIIKGVRDSDQHCARETVVLNSAEGLEGEVILVSWASVPAWCAHSHDNG